MAGEKVDFAKAKAAVSADDTPDEQRQQSTIAFPLYDLASAAEVARHVYERAGLSECPLDELAAQSRSTMSGTFRMKNAAAKHFGFIEKRGSSSVQLSELGCRLVSPESEVEARATAFLIVPLYSQIYEKYRGKLLPPTKALEREFIMLGVTAPQAEKARQIFQRSARQAGFFADGEDRLVRPRLTAPQASAVETIDQVAADRPAPRPTEETPIGRLNGGGGGGHGGYHPFIEGLLQTLPAPGTLWTVEGRAAWLQAAAQNFTLIYKGDGKIEVNAMPGRVVKSESA